MGQGVSFLSQENSLGRVSASTQSGIRSMLAFWTVSQAQETSLPLKTFNSGGLTSLDPESSYIILHTFIERRRYEREDVIVPCEEPSDLNGRLDLLDIMLHELPKLDPTSTQQAFNGADREHFDIVTDVFKPHAASRLRYHVFVFDGQRAPTIVRSAALEHAYGLDRMLGFGTRPEFLASLLRAEGVAADSVMSADRAFMLMNGKLSLMRDDQTRAINALHGTPLIRGLLLCINQTEMLPDPRSTGVEAHEHTAGAGSEQVRPTAGDVLKALSGTM